MTTQDAPRKIFLSHNSKDKGPARALGGQLQLAGADVWFDEWKLQAGDSIPGKLNEALAAFNTFVLVWSANAAGSQWVRRELEVAITRGVADPNTRIIPVVLDETTLPPLISHLLYVPLDENDVAKATMAILGLQSQRELIKMLQAGLDYLDLHYEEFWGVRVLFGCPKCGASVDSLTGWQWTDDEHDRMYAGAQCKECGWHEGSER